MMTQGVIKRSGHEGEKRDVKQERNSRRNIRKE